MKLIFMIAVLVMAAACATPAYVPAQRGNENVQSPGDAGSTGSAGAGDAGGSGSSEGGK